MPTADSPDRPSRPNQTSRTLVLGGARSGKSAHAEELTQALAGAGRVRYVATSHRDPDDHDWEHRIAQHRDRRPGSWLTVETAHRLDLADQLRSPTEAAATLVDDLGTWLTVELDGAAAWESPRGTITSRTDELVASVRDYRGALVLVTPEVGLGVIPETRSGRLFRDEIGALNARLAQVCDRVVLVVAGLTMILKDDPARESRGPEVSTRARGQA
ncbi:MULTISPECIES: bifunctional adenosylcobinamide kinase/adenosylcobinamide-phosphate guanylyltransferase [unclassified Rhodococcus (in: high G+C Gram-positive bacteria)]|uniref:bifunctional adenosylcobinamide kinase/adenosylcobinamide-phosphate guanylyltransferase n=1 Tax=unclassified Rhodococcus (in: high G+C Gram-positive bacteria) TaxID=192944 RepID=UPI0024B64069|nr:MULTISPECIES: bifunctional adenosylcobinamide kinase/adenosylcobinamide-phosphate guanylyltransferase [unclassified Rhodococcus (in: high G+C Gram-positive bacteria)]MDI9950160.1 bifunctional adenosylcobinamide kinase/adenosylcobinamide-phosphate guanylyltransferase [Rhodococcus sp. IEGM 1305]MDI9976892.1 bifunctional adenosylcobinamide kinase/adenosylcobinamide-phosphate guanylyltransferase [Rhodococcus sp. IEGM 1307]